MLTYLMMSQVITTNRQKPRNIPSDATIMIQHSVCKEYLIEPV